MSSLVLQLLSLELMKNSKMLYRNIQVFIDHKIFHPVIVAPTHIAELRAISHTDKGVKFGASVTLTRIDTELKDAIQKYPGIYRSHYVPPSDCCPTHIAELRAISHTDKGVTFGAIE